MRADGWYLTEDVDEFRSRVAGFLRSRPALHTSQLTRIETLSAQGTGGTVCGWLESAGEVCAVVYLRPNRRLTLTALQPQQVDALAALLADRGHSVARVSAQDGTAAAFVEAWQRRTGARVGARVPVRLFRLGTLTPPEPCPAGRVGFPADQGLIRRWCGEFELAVGQPPPPDEVAWAASSFANKRFTFWESPDGTPVSMAGSTTMVAGMVRVDPVYTPAQLRGHGYAGAVTVAVSRAALAAGATDVVLFADPANATSTALYQRIGYVPLADFTVYEVGVRMPST